MLIRLFGLRLGWKVGILPAVTLVALGATLNIDPVYLTIDGFLGAQNFLNLIVHLTMGAGVTELSRLLLEATERTKRHMRFLFILGVVLGILQTILMLLSDTAGSATHFTDTFGDQTLVGLYQATFFGWIGIVFGYTGFECLRRDRAGESCSFRTGFDLVGTGCLVGVLAVLLKLSMALLEILDIPIGRDSITYLLYRLMIGSTILLFCIGFILPSTNRIKSQIATRKAITGDLQTLRPIVTRLVQTPEGARSMHAARISVRSKASKTQLLKWLIFIGDVRVLDPELLSAAEVETVEKIGDKIENH